MQISESVPLIATFDAAWNAPDVPAIMSFFTDDAVVTVDPALPNLPDRYTGKEEIAHFAATHAIGCIMESWDHHAEPGRLTWRANLSSDYLRDRKVDHIECTFEAAQEAGKFASLVIRLDPDTAAKIKA